MARRLEEIVENGSPELDELLACERIDDVLDILGQEYEDMKHPDKDELVEDELEGTDGVDSPIINPVADTLGLEDEETVRMEDSSSPESKEDSMDISDTDVTETELPDDIVLVEETVIIVDDDLPLESDKDGNMQSDIGCRER